MTNALPWSPCPHMPGDDAGLFLARPYAAFGDDLRIDFGQDRPGLVTTLLCACIANAERSPLDADAAWDLSIGKRIQLLLEILARTRGGDHAFEHVCAQCGEASEVTATGEEFFELQRRGEEKGTLFITVPADRAYPLFRLRRPIGRDQLGWLGETWRTEQTAIRAMIGDLSGEDAGPIDATRIAQIAETLDEADPLVNFSITSGCPECDTEQSWSVDLTEYGLSGLRAARRHLLWTVHRLAGVYHWSEKQILDLPPSRRAEYLGLIGSEAVL